MLCALPIHPSLPHPQPLASTDLFNVPIVLLFSDVIELEP